MQGHNTKWFSIITHQPICPTKATTEITCGVKGETDEVLDLSCGLIIITVSQEAVIY